MAAITNTFVTSSAKGNRETLSDVVSRITPEDTPILTAIGTESAKGIHPEWETIDLAAPAANVQAEGDEYAFSASTPAARMGNYTQIMRKTGIVSATQDAVDNAGRAEQLKYQKLMRGRELKKDVEFSIVSNVASVGGTSRVSGGLPSWAVTNVSRGATGANGGYSSGTGLTVAATDGTQRAFTQALLDGVMQSGFNSGANFKSVSVSPYVKSVFVTFMSNTNVANFRYSVDSGKDNSIVSNADYYEGPFGRVKIMPNRVQATSAGVAKNAFLLDPEMLSWAWLRNIQTDPRVAKTGDAEKFVIIGEGCLKVKNEKGIGVIADLFGLTASS
jgi:hypothetical protein